MKEAGHFWCGLDTAAVAAGRARARRFIMVVPGGELPEYVRRAIFGEMTLEEKRAAVDKSTNNWWREYAARKNDEEEEHVADTLLYDERCHLPRMVPRPDVVVGHTASISSVSSAAPPVDAAPVEAAAPSGYLSFIESGFRTKVEHAAALRLLPSDFSAAEAAARAAYTVC